MIAEPGGLVLLTAPAASPAVAAVLAERLAPELRRSGATVTERVVHALPTADARGLVGFYTAVGWVVEGYLGATFFGLIFGPQPGRLRTAWRLTAIGALALVTGFAGAALAAAIGDCGGSVPSRRARRQPPSATSPTSPTRRSPARWSCCSPGWPRAPPWRYCAGAATPPASPRPRRAALAAAAAP